MFQRRNRGGLGLLLLFTQLYNFGFDRIPPVTLSFIAGNVVVYLRLLRLLPRLSDACVSAHHVWYNGDWIRLVLASFYHLDDWHLYYNMASFLWKGKSLETSMGSKKFLLVLGVFSVLTNAVLVGLDMCLAHLLGDPSYIYTCAAGFSGVIFALKVLTTYELPQVSMVMGIFPVPMKYACWAELLLIQLIVPNASFTGHLAGILIGLLYVKGPLKPVINTIASIAFGSPRMRGRSGPSYSYHASSTGTRYTAPASPPQPPNDSDDEELQAAIRASLRETHHPSPPPHNNPPYPSHNGENHPAFQAAIAESLRRQQHNSSTRGNPNPSGLNNESFDQPPSYSEAVNERLYPSIPNGETTMPSAPPPYDSPVEPPYPEYDTMPTPDIIRQRRLRRFQN